MTTDSAHRYRRRIRRAAGLAILLLLVVSVGSLATTSAQDQCGAVIREKPRKDIGRGRPPLAIGDSVMLLAVEQLADIGYRVNSHGCRGLDEAVRVLKQSRRRGRLGRLVVVAVGADYPVTKHRLNKAIRAIGKKRGEHRILALVTSRESSSGIGSDAGGDDAQVVRHVAHKYPHRVRVLDWVKRSAGHGGWFQPDGLHLTYRGADAYAQLFKKARRWADWPRRNK